MSDDRILDPECLDELVVSALERTAFLIVDPCPAEDLPGPFEIQRRARIDISGLGDGCVWLEADDGFVCELAAGLLGCDSDEVDAATTGCEALTELANIIGGSVVVALGGEDREYRLGLPESVAATDDPAGPNDSPENVRTLLASDEGAIAVTWSPATGAGEGADEDEFRAAA